MRSKISVLGMLFMTLNLGFSQPYISRGANSSSIFIIATDGVVYAWGRNDRGQQGDGNTVTSGIYGNPSPNRILKGAYSGTTYLGDNSSNKVIEISAGTMITTALTQDGLVYSWGTSWGNYGQLGINDDDAVSLTPVKVFKGEYSGTTNLGDNSNNKIVKVVSGLYRSYAIDEDGIVYGWGQNNSGRLGDGTTTNRYTPVKIVKGEYSGTTYLGDNSNNKIIDIVVGESHQLALAADGTVYAWGRDGGFQLGRGSNSGDSSTPIKVLKGEYSGTTYLGDDPTNKIIGLNATYATSQALDNNGLVYSWGSGYEGDHGNNESGGTAYEKEPIKVLKGGYSGTTYLGDNSSNKIIKITSGADSHSLALANDGTIYSWGQGRFGNLADNTTNDRLTPVKALKGAYSGTTYIGDNSSNKIIEISAGSYHTTAIDESGNIYSWGSNSNGGALGTNSTTSYEATIPVKVVGVGGTGYLSAGSDNTAPTVSLISSTTNNGTYKTGSIISINIYFTEAVFITGTPQLTLETGSSDAVVNYSSGSGTNTLTFNYTIASGQSSSDLDYNSTSALALNSGTIKDIAGNNATLTLASPGATNSLGANKAIVVDGVVPTIASGSLASNNTYVDITMNEGVYNTSGGSGALETTDFTMTFAQNSGNATAASISSIKNNSGNALSGGETVIRINLSITGTPSGVETITITPASSTSIYDVAGNAMATSQTTGAKTFADQLTPTVSSVSSTTANGTYKIGDVIAVTTTFSENVTVTGTPQLELNTTGSSSSGNSLSFDGTDDYAQVNYSSELAINGPFTASAWVKIPTSHSSNWGTVIGARNGLGILLYAGSNSASGKATIELNSSISATGTSDLRDNKWHYITGIYDGTAAKIYVDGALQGSTDGGRGGVSGTDNFYIGRANHTAATTEHFEGNTNEVAIWNEAITANEITALYNSGTGLDASSNSGNYSSSGNLKGYWKMAEGSGTSIADASGNSNTGTISGASWSADDPGGGAMVNYVSGTGTATLTFNYTVVSGHSSSDLDYSSTSALTLNGGTIRDAAGNAATLTLASPDATNSLGTNKSIVIDGIVPTLAFSPVNNATGVNVSNNITITFSEAVRKIDETALSDSNVDALITLRNADVNGTNIAFDATINSGKTIIAINPSSDFSSEQVIYVAIGATLEDGAGNAITASNATFTGADVNATTVTFSPAHGASNVVASTNVTITFNEAIRKIDDSEITNANVDALITLKNSNSSGNDIAFDATINSGKTLITINPTNDFSSSQVVYSAIGATVEDDANNAITATSSTFTVADIVSPTIASGSLSTDNSYLDITMNEGVYNTNGGSGALEKTDFTITFAQNSGNATAASISSIKNNSGNALSGGESVIRINLSITGTPSGVETMTIVPASSTSIYDASGNAMATSQTTGAKTLNDKLAPVFASEYPKVANVSGTSIDILVKINEAGKGYYVILSNDATAPTSAEVKAGTGSSAATAIKSGNFALTKDTEKSVGITGLTAETPYDVYIITQDGETTPNIQSSPTKIDVSTGDIISPTVSKVSSTVENATYITVGYTIPITVTFSESVAVTGMPQLTMETGVNDALVNYDSGTGSNSLTFHYIIASGDTSSDLSYVSSSSLVLNNGTIKDGAGNAAILALPEPGATNSLSSNKNILIDALLPTVLSVSSTAVDSVYGVGSTIPITVHFSEKIKVEGIPQIIIATGTPGDTANYVSGSTTNILTFNYTVSQADNSSDLDYKDEDALILNNGTIKDIAGNEALLKLVSPGLENSLGANKQLIIDTSGPLVMNITSTTKDGIYKIGDTIMVSINFNEHTYVTGTPQIKLSTGSQTGIAIYHEGNGTKSLSCNYIIQNGHFSSKLDYTSINALELNSATLKDSLGNAALLTLPEPGSDNSLSKNKSIVIDGIVPSISSINEGSLNTDLDYQNNQTDLTLSWAQAVDAFFDTMYYDYSLGITKGGKEIIEWTSSNGELKVQLSGLTLIENVTYYSSVKATDGAGNISPVLQGDGITIDKTAPITSDINDGLGEDVDISTSSKTITANWLQFNDATSYVAKYEYTVGTVASGNDVKDWTDIGTDTSFIDSSFTLNHAQIYFVSVKATDAAGNVSKVSTSDGVTIDLYPGPPSVKAISVSEGTYLPLTEDVPITIDFSEAISDYKISFSSQLKNSVNYNESKDGDEITINIKAPLTSLDTLSLLIENVTDLVGNVSDNIEYQFFTSLIADFTGDQIIDASDLTIFLNAWNGGDTKYELGPVEGTPPHFTITKDGKYDLRDLMSLTRIWDWSRTALSKLSARSFEQSGDSLKHYVLDNNISLFIPKDVGAVDLFINYPSLDVSVKSLETTATVEKILLSYADSINGILKIVAGYLEPKVRIINLPYNIKGKENIPINIGFRMIGNNGVVIGQGEKTIQLVAVPKKFQLHQNYPNPFNPVTTINYDLPQQTYVNLMIYDILGREVVKLVSEEIPAGYQSVIWNTRNNFGKPVSAGIYFYQIQTKGFVKTRKMVLLK